MPDDVARLEVVQGWRGDDGVHRGALAIRLLPGWKTYWRAAGEGGIPPSFDWSGSDNLADLEIHFPVPEVFDQNGMRSYGYETEVMLPFKARAGSDEAEISLSGSINIGVCLDVCVPVTLEINDILPPTAAEGQAQIRAAFEDRPMTAAEAGLGGMSCQIEPIADGLRVSAEVNMKAMKDEFAAVMELPDRTIWISETDVVQDGARLVATAEMVPQAAAPFFLARDSLRMTLIGQDQAIELVGCG